MFEKRLISVLKILPYKNILHSDKLLNLKSVRYVCIYDTCVYDICIYDICIYDICIYGICIYDICIYDIHLKVCEMVVVILEARIHFYQDNFCMLLQMRQKTGFSVFI